MTAPTGETLSLWMRDPDAGHAWMRIVAGGDPKDYDNRRVFVEKSPRVHDPAHGLPPSRAGEQSSWVFGPKGHADDGQGPDLASRRWADEKARELGYVLPDMRAEIARLKADWLGDGGWDIEDAEGFEEHREELLAYRKLVEGDRAARRALEREAAILALLKPALDSLPEQDAGGGLTRAEAERPGAANRLLRAVAAMLLPVVQRMEYLDDQHDRKLDRIQEQIDVMRHRR